MNKEIAILPGDGIGPEVVDQAIKVLTSIQLKYGHKFKTHEHLIGAAAMDKALEPLPADTLQACMQSDAIVFGAVGHPRYDSNPAAEIRPEQGLFELRRKMELHTNVRPMKSHRRLLILSPLKEEWVYPVDLIFFRELTGGIYFGKKEQDELGRWAVDESFYHRDEISRVTRMAFDEARTRRKKLTSIDKANTMVTGRLWRKTVNEIHEQEYPDIELDHMYADIASMQLVLNPRQFDVILTENLFGDLLSDQASALIGSIGLMPSGSYGEGDKAIFEPIHGPYVQAAGRNIANPMASILSIAMLMEHFHLEEEERLIQQAVDFTIQEGLGTMDMVPRQMISCSALGDFLAQLILEPKVRWPEIRKSLSV
jgi:3-isopropylmalate dehydrogenase